MHHMPQRSPVRKRLRTSSLGRVEVDQRLARLGHERLLLADILGDLSLFSHLGYAQLLQAVQALGAEEIGVLLHDRLKEKGVSELAQAQSQWKWKRNELEMEAHQLVEGESKVEARGAVLIDLVLEIVGEGHGLQ